ncbi:MAG: hypothetical protein DRO99_05090 [Candidatus Aenigmatarchaeota archaeon]|nr:MAG: hypothetical protein DRO99_05090 [Candidatus Aenigmarchaeota archaeon]
MKPDFYNGFTVYKNPNPRNGLVFIMPHSGPALETPVSRDDNSETVGSLCAMELGGHMVISNVSRKPIYGIDFNRDIPTKEMALKYYPVFVEDKERLKLKKYRDRYGWVAKDTGDYYSRLRTYKQFWSIAKGLGSFYVLMHRKLPRIKNYPSVMDIATFGGRGIDQKVLKTIVDEVNNERTFFKTVAGHYKDSIVLEESRVVNRIEQIFSEFSLRKIQIEYKENIMQDLKAIRRHADKRFYGRLKKNFTKKNFLMCVRNALRNAPDPLITMDTIFKGELSFGPKKQLDIDNRNIVMQIELNEFFSRFYPNDAAEIISHIITKIKSVEKYKSLGLTQTEMLKFLKV